MKRTLIALIAALASVAGIAAGASASGDTSAHSAGATRVLLRQTSIGRILVNSSGATLYRFGKDTRDTDTCIKVSGCLRVWPALTSTSRPEAGTGVHALLLGTITLPGGAKQVTYAGAPLYLYAPEPGPGTGYVGASSFGGTWDAVSALGAAVR